MPTSVREKRKAFYINILLPVCKWTQQKAFQVFVMSKNRMLCMHKSVQLSTCDAASLTKLSDGFS
jgi:hypothetical protein